MTRLEDELAEALAADGIEPAGVLSLQVLPDGTEVRGVVEGLEFVRHLMVMFGDRVDEDEAKMYLRLVFAWLRRRRSRGDPDDVRFVSIYGAGNSVLRQVPVPIDLSDSKIIRP